MARGALKGGPANVAIGPTGVAGPDAVDGIVPGTRCFAWLFSINNAAQLLLPPIISGVIGWAFRLLRRYTPKSKYRG